MSLCNAGGLQLVAILSCILTLAACGDLPRPFQPSDKSPPDIAEEEIGKRAGIFVQPIVDLKVEESERLTEALVTALQSEDVAANRLARNRASLRISAHPIKGGRLRWLLVAANGKILFSFEEARSQAGARRAAKFFANFLNSQPSAATYGLALFVPAIDGAPGDGQSALSKAMRQSLAARGFAIVDAIDDVSYLVLGSVHVTLAQLGGQETVKVDWTVLAPDGARLGTVSQSNNVPTGTLYGRWGAVARIVAENGAQGVVTILTRLGVLE